MDLKNDEILPTKNKNYTYFGFFILISPPHENKMCKIFRETPNIISLALDTLYHHNMFMRNRTNW